MGWRLSSAVALRSDRDLRARTAFPPDYRRCERRDGDARDREVGSRMPPEVARRGTLTSDTIYAKRVARLEENAGEPKRAAVTLIGTSTSMEGERGDQVSAGPHGLIGGLIETVPDFPRQDRRHRHTKTRRVRRHASKSRPGTRTG